MGAPPTLMSESSPPESSAFRSRSTQIGRGVRVFGHEPEHVGSQQMFDKALERGRGGEELAYGRDDVAVLALHGPCE